MPQTLRGDVIRNDNIAVGLVCGIENAVARGVPAPTPPNECVQLVTGSYAAAVVADGASNYWRLGESSGLTAVDAVGGANGTISGGVTLNQPGALSDGDKAMTFDPVANGYITTVSTSVSVPLTVTLEAWVKLVDGTGYHEIVSSRNWDSAAPLMLGVLDSRALSYGDAATPAAVAASIPLSNGIWYHLVVVQTGSVCSLYVNGVLDRSASQLRGGTPLPSKVSIGAFTTTTNYFSGSIDEVAIYPVALTPAQIAAHYQLRLSGPVSPYGVENIAVGIRGPNPEVP